MSWILEVAKIETKRTLSYRVDFWLQFGVVLVVELSVAYFLWLNIYGDDKAQLIGGYTFNDMILYYLFVPFVGRIVRSDEAYSIARDIKEGGLNKFLVYPISFIQYKIIEKFVYSTLALMQMMLGLFIISFFFDFHFTIPSFLLGILAAYSSMILYSLMFSTLELVAFWAETVWSLGVMLRFIGMFFGGAFVPLSLFPDWGLKILYMTPFPYLFSNAIKTFMGQSSTQETLEGVLITLLWCIPVSLTAAILYRKGLKGYSGIGI